MLAMGVAALATGAARAQYSIQIDGYAPAPVNIGVTLPTGGAIPKQVAALLTTIKGGEYGTAGVGNLLAFCLNVFQEQPVAPPAYTYDVEKKTVGTYDINDFVAGPNLLSQNQAVQIAFVVQLAYAAYYLAPGAPATDNLLVAAQLAIWDVMGGTLGYTFNGNAGIEAAYNGLTGAFAGLNYAGFDTSPLLFLNDISVDGTPNILGDDDEFQDLVVWNGLNSPIATPLPSSALLGLIAVAVLGVVRFKGMI